MRTNKISLPPISDILVNHLPAPVYQKQPSVPQQQYPVPPQQQLHQGSYSGGSTVLPPLARSTSTPSVPAPPYKYYDYYYGRDPATVPHGHSHGHSASNSVSSTSSVSTAGIAGAAAYPPTRSPLSHNSSPVYSNETTPPPSMIRYSHPQYQQYPPYVPPYQGHPLQQHLSSQHHAHYPPPLHKSLSSPDTRTLSDDDDDVHHLRGNSKRKTRNNLPKETTYILLKWLNDHLNHPYPNSFEKNQLMSSTGLNQQQLSNWFINARRRKIKSLKEQKRLDL